MERRALVLTQRTLLVFQSKIAARLKNGVLLCTRIGKWLCLRFFFRLNKDFRCWKEEVKRGLRGGENKEAFFLPVLYPHDLALRRSDLKAPLLFFKRLKNHEKGCEKKEQERLLKEISILDKFNLWPFSKMMSNKKCWKIQNQFNCVSHG